MCLPLGSYLGSAFRMIVRKIRPLRLLAFALALVAMGCGDGRKAPGTTAVQVINAAPSYSSLNFRRGPITNLTYNPLVNLQYLGGSQQIYGEDTYTFYVSTTELTTSIEHDIDNFAKEIVSGTAYTIVLYESGGKIAHAILESPTVAGNAANAQVQAMHAVDGLPSVDFYLVPSGAAVIGATPLGTLSFGGSVASTNVSPGDYQIIVTEAGNAANVLSTSPAFTLTAAASTTFVLSPDADKSFVPFRLVGVGGSTSTVLDDPSTPASIRVINGATDRQPRDVAFNGEFSPPLFSAVPFAAPTPYEPLPSSTDAIAVNVTPPGNPGVLEYSGSTVPAPATKYTAAFTGDPGALILTMPVDDRRRVTGASKLSVYDLAPAFPFVDFMILPPGTDPTTALPATTAAPPSVTSFPWGPGTYEIWARDSSTATMLAGPVTVTVAEKGLYGFVLSNNPNGTTVDIALIDDFQQ